MPATITFLQTCLLLWSAFKPWGDAVPLRSVTDCPGYKASNVKQTDNCVTADLTLAGSECNIYGQDLHDLKFLAEYQTGWSCTDKQMYCSTYSRVHVIIYDKDEQVYQVPDFVVPRPEGSESADASLLEVSIEEDPFSFTVTRKSNKEVIFSTKGSNIVFESQYLRVRTSLPDNPNLYGLGEHTDSLRLPTSNYIRTLWARDAGAVPQNSNLYGTHPVYYDYRSDSGNTHAVLLLNSNGMDININKDNEQYLEYNVLGGVIDFYFLAGPSPWDAAREYSDISQKAAMMPYWGFGFHQCRFGYHSAQEVAQVVKNYSAANIPLETMWTDIDYMDHFKVFTLGANFSLKAMRDLVNDLHSNDQHYVVMVDPDYDAFNNGKKAGIFLKNDDGSIYRGQVWPGVTAFPDWFHGGTQDYWDGEFASFFSPDNGVDIDALWIDMNEPSNFCVYPCIDPASSSSTSELLQSYYSHHGSGSHNLMPRGDVGAKKGLPNRNLLDPPYKIHNTVGIISNKTANTSVVHQDGWVEYDTHNLFGTMMSKTSRNSMLKRRPDKRPMVITRSTYVGAGSYVGHWLGDNVSAWDQYITSIRHLLQFAAFFQVPMVGADVCGFLGDTTENLCARWTTLGAFYPFYRNHNVDGAIDQEAYRWESVAAAARKAIDIRYRLLDYIYTALYQQTQDGTPMVAPVWMHYPDDYATLGIDNQFFFGPSLLVSPVRDQDSTSVSFYLPEDVWYDLFTLKPVSGSGETITYSDVDFQSIPVHIKGGSIIPARVNSANTTKDLRDQDFELLVGLDTSGRASGKLYLDDGESINQKGVSDIEFTFEGSTIKMKGTFGYKTNLGVQSITLIGKGYSTTKYELNEGLDGPWSHDIGSLKSRQL